jgi:hypothetical protein
LRAENDFIAAIEEYRALILRAGIFVNPQSLGAWFQPSPAGDHLTRTLYGLLLFVS